MPRVSTMPLCVFLFKLNLVRFSRIGAKATAKALPMASARYRCTRHTRKEPTHLTKTVQGKRAPLPCVDGNAGLCLLQTTPTLSQYG